MAAATISPDRIEISTQTIDEVKRVNIPENVEFSIHTHGGEEIKLPQSLQDILAKTLASIAKSGEVSIGRVPDELTSTVAADMLGVSRPTLMKWVKEGKIASHKVGSHTRFRREDVLSLRDERARQRQATLRDMRALMAKHASDFDD